MQPIQQVLQPGQLSPNFRQNYHINPAESKLVYQSPQSIQLLQNTKTSPQYPILNSLPLQQNLPPQQYQLTCNVPEHQFINQRSKNQNFTVQNTQKRSLSPLPANQPQILQSHQMNQPPQNMIYTFQPLSPQPQRGIIQSEYHKSSQRPLSNNILRSVPVNNQPLPQGSNINQYPSQNTVPITQSIAQSVQSQQKYQNVPNVSFNQSYGFQQSYPTSNVVIKPQPQPQTVTQPIIPMISSKPGISGSTVQINFSTTSPNIESTYKPAVIINSENVSIQKASIEQKGQALESKIQYQFQMTNSLQVSNAGKQEVKKEQNYIQKVEETLQRQLSQNAQQVNNSRKLDQTTDKIWQQRFVMIYQKFQWFYERYDFISREFQVLSQEFENVNSEDQWLQLKEKHDLLLEKIHQIQEELVNTIHENQQLAEHYQLQNNTQKSSPQEQQIWQHRYHELLEEYKSLSQNYADLQTQNSEFQIKNQQQKTSNIQENGMTLEEQNELKLKFHELQTQYNVLCDEYQKIRIQYERIYQENTHYNQENNELLAKNQQTSTLANQLQAYVQQLQYENDQIKKQERKSTNSHENCVSKDQAENMHRHFTQEIQKYQQELQKYRFTFQQYEDKLALNTTQLQKISEIALERQKRIKQLEAQNTVSKSGHSNTPISIENQQMERRYVNILEQDVRLWKEKEIDLLHKLQIKDMQKRSFEQKFFLLERQLQNKNSQLQKITKNFDQKLLKIQQNTANKLQGFRQQQEDSNKGTSSSQQEIQVYELQTQIQEMQFSFNSKLNAYKQMEQQLKNYEAQLRKQSNALNLSQIQHKKRISEMQIEMGRKIAEKEMKITVLNGEIQRLNDMYENSNKQKQSIRETLKISLQQSERQLTQKHNEVVAELQRKIQSYEKQIEQKMGEINLSRQLINRFEKEMKGKNEELMEMRNFITQMKKNTVPSHSSRSEVQTLKDEIRTKQEIIERKNDQLTKIKREKDYKVKYISQLESELQFVNTELNKRRSQVSTLKRQISDLQALETEYEILKSNMNKKQTQITQLKQDSLEMEKFKMLADTQSRDLERLIQDNKEKQTSIHAYKQKISQLENYISKNTSSFNINNNNTSSERKLSTDEKDNKEYKQLIKRKDAEISRLNQLLQENQYIIQNKSRQLETQKLQAGSVLRSKDSEIYSLNHNIALLQTRVRQAENKKQKLTEQINELRVTFEQQLNSESQRQKNFYDKVVARHQQDYKQIKEKLRTAQQNYNIIEMELQKYKSNQKKLNIQIKQLTNKLNEQNSVVLQKEELFSTFRIKQSQTQQSSKALYEKLSSLELQLKTKQQQLKLSQQKNIILEQKIKKNKKDYENFRNKLIISQQYENNNSVVEYLSKRIAEYESKMINQSQRDFAFKVKDPDSNQVFENQVVYQLKIENDMLRKQLQGKGIQHDRKILSQLEEENLKRSKNLLKNSTFSSKIGNVASQLLIKDNMEEMNFYKEKNRQLQERVEKHLTVNKELKQKIQALIKSNSGPKELQYYKEQITEYENKIVQLERKIEALTEQNKNLSREITKKQSRVEGRYEERITQIESKLNESSRIIQQLSQEKSQYQLSITKLQMQKSSMQDEIKRLNSKIVSVTASQNAQNQQQINTLRENCDNYQTQIAKLTSRCRFLEDEISRLSEITNSNKSNLNELNSLKSRVNELTQQMTKTLNDFQQSQLKVSSLTSENSMLQTKIRTFQNQVQRLNQMIQLYSKKQKTDLTESNVLKQSTSSLQIQISTLENQLAMLTAQREQEFVKVNEMMGKIGFYEELLRSLNYELELIRSDVLLQQSLVEELAVGGDNPQEVLNELRVNIRRKLDSLNQLFSKLSRL